MWTIGASGAPFLPQAALIPPASITTQATRRSRRIRRDLRAAVPVIEGRGCPLVNLLRCYRARRVAYELARHVTHRLERGTPLRRLEPAHVDPVAADFVVEDPFGGVEQA